MKIKGLFIAIPMLLAYAALIFLIGFPGGYRRSYIRLWLWWNRFCKHGHWSGSRYTTCAHCEKERELKTYAENEAHWAKRRAAEAKAAELVKDL